ncbi:response regulator [Desulfohalovibrio reitneri]|uniref:response regulator n=1 Tax=Desulfohalovibrio reitneri TaxID=1307759 RepID=UPI00055891C9|nr:response regulator [Desulfohalovibrio reitneri]
MSKRVMIVEDEAVTAMFLEHELTQGGFEVPHVADTGRGAITYAEGNPLDAIIMDIRLKDDVDGIEAARVINRGIPVIYHSAYADDETITRARETNPADFLEKPAPPESILASLHRVFARQR